MTGACVLLSLPALATGNLHFTLSPVARYSLLFQTVVVSFFSYLIWFSLLRRYQASSLGILTFMTPVFGIRRGASFSVSRCKLSLYWGRADRAGINRGELFLSYLF